MSNRLFVGNLNWRTNAQTLGQLFEQKGEVNEAVIVSRGSRSLGYGFVTMKNEEGAKAAREAFNQYTLDERPIHVEYAKSTGPHPPGPRPQTNRPSRGGRGRGARRGFGRGRGRYNKFNRRPRVEHKPDDPVSATRIHVRNLPYSLTNGDFEKAFQNMGVKECIIIRDRFGRSSGYGFVECNDHAAQQKILEKPELEFSGRKAYLAAAYERPQQPQQKTQA